MATTAADGSLRIFFGTDSGFEGPTSVYFTRATAVLAPLPPVNLSTVLGDFLGNFDGPSSKGQVALKIGKSGAFTSTVVTVAGRSAIRGKFPSSGVVSVAVGLPSGSLELLLKTRGLEDGRLGAADEVYLEAILRSGGGEIPFELRSAPRKGGQEALLVGKTINTLLESHKEAGKGFGFGFAVRPAKDGVCRFAGARADGTKRSSSARVVEHMGRAVGNCRWRSRSLPLKASCTARWRSIPALLLTASIWHRKNRGLGRARQIRKPNRSNRASRKN